MSVLICGSYAYDHIMVFSDRFKNHILPDKVHMINVSFLVPQMRREFGGTAGNIAYNLNALGEPALPMATVGMDFSAYSHWMQQCGVNEQHITIVDEQYTGQAFITTDLDDNQITAFHPGAMSESHRNAVTDAQGVELGIVSPDGRQGMIDHAAQFAEAGIPFIFDPGQGMPMFDGNDLTQFVEQASWVAVNDYESALLSERTGLSLEQIAERVHGLIVTRGGEGSHIYANGGRIDIPPVRVEAPVDPTGCGDAYRAGLLFGLRNDLDWETTGRAASLMGAIKIAHAGTQNHALDRTSFEARFAETWGYRLAL